VGDVQLREATLVALFRLRGVAEASATYSYTFGDPSRQTAATALAFLKRKEDPPVAEVYVTG
jgi:hypothetical protein